MAKITWSNHKSFGILGDPLPLYGKNSQKLPYFFLRGSLSVSFWSLPPPERVLSSHLLPKTLPDSFHPATPLAKVLFASSPRASLTAEGPRVVGLVAGPVAKPNYSALSQPLPPTHCFSEEEGDKGELASSGQRHTHLQSSGVGWEASQETGADVLNKWRPGSCYVWHHKTILWQKWDRD